MPNFGEKLLESLSLIKGNGSFVTNHQLPFVFPGLSVEGLEEIAYPINSLQAKTLIQVAHKAPFGKGSQTIMDETVRSAWEIDADKLYFEGQQWEAFLLKVIKILKPQLGIEAYEVTPQLYKMLIYEEGDFFLSHRDSEKETGMFGTLIIGLPSKHNGGELVVRFDGEEKCVSFANASSNNQISFAAFYADCEHEIKPLTSGYRVCLVYNLIQQKSERSIRLEPLSEYVSMLSETLKSGTSNSSFSPGIVLLGHQYTPENFSRDNLKLNDRTKAEALLRAAEDAGYYAKMCLVTSHQSGIPAYESGYGWQATPDDDAEMGEVYEEWIAIELWLEEGVPPMHNLEIKESDLLATFKLNEGEAIVKENTGYMGNYGPDLMHWYHYGAVVFWPKENHADLLLKQDISTQLEWLTYYNSNRDQLTPKELDLCENILTGIIHMEDSAPKADYNVVADWIVGYQDETAFLDKGYSFLQRFFQYIEPTRWISLVEAYPANHFEKIFGNVSQLGDTGNLSHLLSILRTLADSTSGRKLAVSQMTFLPDYFSFAASVNSKKPLLNASSLNDLLELEKLFPQSKEWIHETVSSIWRNNRTYVNAIIIPSILNLSQKTDLSSSLNFNALNYLQDRVENKPTPPADWSREVPKSAIHGKMWKLLEAFLRSPVEQVFEFRRNQAERSAMEYAIRNVKIDLRTETIKIGSPHTLRIIKTQAAYERQMIDWDEDVRLLKRLKKFSSL